MSESRQHSRQWPGEVGHLIAVHSQAHGPVHVQVSIGVHDHHADLWREPRERVLRKRYALKGLQALIDAAHATTAPAGQNKSRDVGFIDGHNGFMLSNLAGAHHRIS